MNNYVEVTPMTGALKQKPTIGLLTIGVIPRPGTRKIDGSIAMDPVFGITDARYEKTAPR